MPPRSGPPTASGGGVGRVLASTNEGELVEIDLDLGIVTLIGDVGTFDGDELGWTDIAVDASGRLFALSRIFTETDFKVHLRELHPDSAFVIDSVGSAGEHAFSDFDFDGGVLFGSGGECSTSCCGQLFSMDVSSGQATWISSDTLGFGLNPFDTIGSAGPIARGGFSVHPVTGDFWGIEALQSQAPVVYRIDPTTGVADSILRLGVGGVPASSAYGFDGLHILEDGTFIATRGGPFAIDSVLWEIGSVPDPVSGLAEIAVIPLAPNAAIAGKLNGLARIGGGVDPVVAIESIAYEAEAGTFTTQDGEASMTAVATVVPPGLADEVTWSVSDWPNDQVASTPPEAGTLAQGRVVTWRVSEQDTTRWPEQEPHPGPVLLDQKSIAFRVIASVVDGQGLSGESEPHVVRQDEIDTIRQEYVDFLLPFGGLRVPTRGDFALHARCNIVCVHNGDYGFAIVDPRFEPALDDLRAAWPLQWQVNVTYRNPVHQRYHVGSVTNSWHQYGCAADLQTFPVPRTTPEDQTAAAAFWNALSVLARRRGFDVEPITQSGVGHVHVEVDCPAPTP